MEIIYMVGTEVHTMPDEIFYAFLLFTLGMFALGFYLGGMRATSPRKLRQRVWDSFGYEGWVPDHWNTRDTAGEYHE